MKPQSALVLFPHQLFEKAPGLELDPEKVFLIEDSLFFGDSTLQPRFHKQKLWFHRATMTRYAESLREAGRKTDYLEHTAESDPLAECLARVKATSGLEVITPQPHDFLLKRRIERLCEEHSIKLGFIESPMFLNGDALNKEYRATKKSWRMVDFYKFQRRRLDILMDQDKPVGDQWSFDKDNRKKVPKAKLGQIPALPTPQHDEIDLAAKAHILEHYPDNPGSLDTLFYPTRREDARLWLSHFLQERLPAFGDYEDAMVRGENWLWHSAITPFLNTGLLTPGEVVEETLKHAADHPTPLNSLEGFVRQIIGWREFMRATYDDLGVRMRTTNHWGHTRKIPESFYTGTTGIGPIDDVIGRILETGYCHHIERLMVLGGFMFLCEFHPDGIYQWFMEMFVDSYDWVMVPNVYAMSQHADGGLITTKPYFSGSSYIRKMSNHPAGEWTETWDGLYWRWVWNHADELGKNPRWSMMCAMARKMDASKRQAHLRKAEDFLDSLQAV